MRVMMLNASDVEGGAARGALRLLDGVRAQGVDARLLVQVRHSDHPWVIGPRGTFEKAMGLARPVLEVLSLKPYGGRGEGMFSPALVPDRLPERVLPFAPDLVHLHWVANGMIRVESLARFRRPLLWTLHDSWPFTGGCHVPFDCTRYRESCGRCPALGSDGERDVSRRLWGRKKRSWQDLDLTVVAPSNWLAGCARQSSLFKDVRVERIPNGLDLARYRPVDRGTARDLLGLPRDRKLILFGGKGGTSDRNKGFHLLLESLGHLARRGWGDKADLVLFGASRPEPAPDLGFASHWLGWLNDDVSMTLMYAAADVFVAPSMQENLSYTVMEALACGTPCVAFDQGGTSDLVEQGVTGFRARCFDPEDLARSVAWVLQDDDLRRVLSFQARQKVEREFSLELVARRYAELYAELAARP